MADTTVTQFTSWSNLARWDAGREPAQAALGLDDGTVPLAELPRRAVGARIVASADNPDMRDYLTRLLHPLRRWKALREVCAADAAISRHWPGLAWPGMRICEFRGRQAGPVTVAGQLRRTRPLTVR